MYMYTYNVHVRYVTSTHTLYNTVYVHVVMYCETWDQYTVLTSDKYMYTVLIYNVHIHVHVVMYCQTWDKYTVFTSDKYTVFDIHCTCTCSHVLPDMGQIHSIHVRQVHSIDTRTCTMNLTIVQKLIHVHVMNTWHLKNKNNI